MACVLAIAVLVAFAVDLRLGEPPVRWHPVVWMGNYLGWAGRWLQGHTRQLPKKLGSQELGSDSQIDLSFQKDYPAFWLGAVAWLVGATMVVAVALALQVGVLGLTDVVLARLTAAGPGALPNMASPLRSAGAVLIAAALLGLLLKPMMAWALLRSEVLAVERALCASEGGSLAAGRERLRWLVSRDVTALSETQVRESAIETLAENLNDSVVAPIFWFALLGLPGAALFRFANTADAMWGYPGNYQGRNWQWAGKWAARADDVLAWLPARLTALLLTLAAGGLSWARLTTEARRTPSPNSGWPMAAMALALDVCLAKPGGYVLHAQGRSAADLDMPRAMGLAQRAVLLMLCLAPGLLVALGSYRATGNP